MLSLVHLIYMAGDKCMRRNACLYTGFVSHFSNVIIVLDSLVQVHTKDIDRYERPQKYRMY